ncbi:LCP family protein [Rummeliibacillus sp. NPDC094406]|uniref:LCP family glycopolymer transferase n=1 Tax=Rummeliibacillus sp. NPDC094406 TaxID=3364511 RepID=UPI00382D57CC
MKWCLGIIIIVIIGIGGFAYTIYYNATSTIEKIYTPIEHTPTEQRAQPVTLQEKQPFSMLLLGVDEREHDKGRSDTIIVLSVNPQTKNTLMVSIPRDTYTTIVGKNTKDKINHAYAFGGIEMSMKSVEKLLDIPIDYVAKVNMEGFEQVINTLGDIQVQNEIAFQQGSHHFKKGMVTLDGEAALDYVRMRKEDPQGDFGRQNRQKQVIQSIIEKGTSLKTLMKYQDIFNILGKNVSTNLTFNQIKELQQNYRQSFKDIKQIHFEKGQGKIINGIWYYIMDKKELSQASSTLQKHLEVSSTKKVK